MACDITNAVAKFTGKFEHTLPMDTFQYMKTKYGINPKIDLCASDYSDNEFVKAEMELLYQGLDRKYSLINSRCEKYFTEKDDMFKQDVTEEGYMNPVYRKSFPKKGIKGTAEFIEFAYNQHLKHNIKMSVLLPSFVSSSIYYQKFMGEEDVNLFGERCQVKKLPKRIQFQCRHGFTNGSPAFSSILVIWDRHEG